MKYILTFMIFLFLSCGSHNKITKDLIELQSTSISIPRTLTTVYNGIDAITSTPNINEFKFVVYADSMGCTSCSVNKMHSWEPFLIYAKSYGHRLRFYFIFHPANANIDKLRNAMMTNSIDYPMLIDLNGDFERLNPHLPKNKAMHTFLLDENNKVILVGNPLYNKEIEKLFYKKTQELLSK